MQVLEKIWSGKRDLNPRPSPWQGDALPLSYSRFDRSEEAGFYLPDAKTVKPEATNIVVDSTSGTYSEPRWASIPHEQTPWPALEI